MTETPDAAVDEPVTQEPSAETVPEDTPDEVDAATPSGSVYEPYRAGVEAGSRTIGQFTDQPRSAGDDVQELQRRLNDYNPKLSRLAVDGYFGPRTTDRVRYVQHKSRITVDGIVGDETWQRLLARQQ